MSNVQRYRNNPHISSSLVTDDNLSSLGSGTIQFPCAIIGLLSREIEQKLRLREAVAGESFVRRGATEQSYSSPTRTTEPADHDQETLKTTSKILV